MTRAPLVWILAVMGIAKQSRMRSALAFSASPSELVLEELRRCQQVVSSQELIERMVLNHTIPRARANTLVKNALAELKAKEAVHLSRVGRWAIGPSPSVNREEKLGSVYVYYFETYKEKEIKLGKNRWPCKIGFTLGDPATRVASQTGHPEKAQLSLVLHSPQALLLEKALHAMLKFQGRHLSDAGGTEWFLTSPQEINEMADFLMSGSHP